MKKLFLASLFAISAFAVHSQTKIAHVDVQKVIDTLPSYKSAVKQLQELMMAAEKDLSELEAALEKAKTDYENATNTPDVSPITKERLYRAAQMAQKRLMEAEEVWQKDLRVWNDRLNKPIMDRVNKAIENVGDRLKLGYILDVNSTHYAKGEDVTNAVIVEALALDKAAMAKEKAAGQ